MARPLDTCAKALQEAVQGQEIDPIKFCEGGAVFVKLIDSLGPFAIPVAQEAQKNLNKI